MKIRYIFFAFFDSMQVTHIVKKNMKLILSSSVLNKLLLLTCFIDEFLHSSPRYTPYIYYNGALNYSLLVHILRLGLVLCFTLFEGGLVSPVFCRKFL